MNGQLFPAEVQGPATFERWGITVTRANGTVELLPYLHRTQAEAEHQARGWAGELHGVTVTTAKCEIRVENQPMTAVEPAPAHASVQETPKATGAEQFGRVEA